MGTLDETIIRCDITEYFNKNPDVMFQRLPLGVFSWSLKIYLLIFTVAGLMSNGIAIHSTAILSNL
ncbi:hypothetical protein BCE02nite_60060 [Brevibacillus centrosporus]|nr:hypothetical protein BCE02nite_60060 [Brevibacillus centrosporus]